MFHGEIHPWFGNPSRMINSSTHKPRASLHNLVMDKWLNSIVSSRNIRPGQTKWKQPNAPRRIFSNKSRTAMNVRGTALSPRAKKKGKRFQRRTASQLSIESRTSLSGEVSGLQQSHSSQDRTKKRPKIETRLHSVQPRPVQLQLGVNRSQLGQLDS